MAQHRARYEASNDRQDHSLISGPIKRVIPPSDSPWPQHPEHLFYDRSKVEYTQLRPDSTFVEFAASRNIANGHLGLGSYLIEWWKEVVAILLSVAFLIAACMVLSRIQDTPLQNWNAPWSIKPTTLVATLITLCKLFLLSAVAEAISQLKWTYFEKQARRLNDVEHFDSASRGAFGAVAFLFRVRWRATLACIGALAIILAIAMEPFAQQTLSFYDRRVAAGVAEASVPYATNYDMNTQVQESPYAGEMNSMNRKAYAPMLGGMLEGLYNPGNTVKPNCGTSNCTFVALQTLGICSSCKDVSESLKTNCRYHDTNISMSGGGVCKYEVPSGDSLQAYCYQNGGGSQSTLWNSTTIYASPPDITKILAISFEADAPELANCALNESFRMPEPVATECSISWCAKSVHNEVVNGSLSENVTSQTNLIFPQDKCNASYYQNVDLGWALNKFSYDPSAETIPPTVEIFAAFLPGEVPRNMCADWRSHPNHAFWINVQDSADIGSLFATIFTASYTSAYTYNTLFGELLYAINNGNLSTDLEAMVASMTNRVRQGPNSTIHNGTAWTRETYIRVNWLWFIFPCGLVLLVTCFFVAAVVSSAQGSRSVWKSSSLALLFHGLWGWLDGVNLSSSQKTSTMHQTAKALRVQLAASKEGEMKLVVQ